MPLGLAPDTEIQRLLCRNATGGRRHATEQTSQSVQQRRQWQRALAAATCTDAAGGGTGLAAVLALFDLPLGIAPDTKIPRLLCESATAEDDMSRRFPLSTTSE